MAIQLFINCKSMATTENPRTPLLWVLRDTFGLAGEKFGCGIADRGAYTVIVNRDITTFECLSSGDSHPVSLAPHTGLDKSDFHSEYEKALIGQCAIEPSPSGEERFADTHIPERQRLGRTSPSLNKPR